MKRLLNEYLVGTCQLTTHPPNLPYLALPQVDGEVDELGVPLDQLLQLVVLQVLAGLLLHHQGDGGSPLEGGASGVHGNGEVLCVGGPYVLLVIIVLGGDYDRVSN